MKGLQFRKRLDGALEPGISRCRHGVVTPANLVLQSYLGVILM